ncbi:MAG: hypothetical protein ABI288_06310 [Ginsengibacter sp.]
MKVFILLFLSSMLTTLNIVIAQQKPASSGEIPILAWYGIPPNETSIGRYEELKASGITYSFTSFPDIKSMEKALEIAQRTGIKMLVSCPELKTDTKKTVQKFMNHPAVAGYFLRDEPTLKDFDELGVWAKQIRAIDDRHFCYINLFPNYANEEQLGTKEYKDYVHQFIEKVPVQKLSFDNYPIKETTLEKRWYQNLEIFSEEARLANKPFWAFALSVNFATHHVPTVAELRLQVYSDLAYGAQGIQYFTYSTPPGQDIDFNNAPIGLDGKRTEVYDRIRLMNNEITNLSWVFMGAKVVSVAHTGETIPLGTKRLVNLPERVKVLETTGTGALVSELKNGTNSFLVILNRDFINPMKLTLYCDPSVRKVLKDGSLVAANDYKNTMEIDAGDAAIYTWTTKIN